MTNKSEFTPPATNIAVDPLFSVYEKLRHGGGQEAVSNWILTNSEKPIDDVAKAKEFAQDAEAHATMLIEAVQCIGTPNDEKNHG